MRKRTQNTKVVEKRIQKDGLGVSGRLVEQPVTIGRLHREILQERFKRQTEIFNPEKSQEEITIIGAGNIGGQTAWGLAKMGIANLTVYDFDIVEEHNLASQIYGIHDVGEKKVNCLHRIIRNATGIGIKKKDLYTNQLIKGILIIAVDSIEMRKQIGKAISSQPPRVIIDGRMGGNVIEIYTKTDPQKYLKTLDPNVESIPCGGRYISYTSLACASLITNQVKRFLRNEPLKENILIDLDTLRFA